MASPAPEDPPPPYSPPGYAVPTPPYGTNGATMNDQDPPKGGATPPYPPEAPPYMAMGSPSQPACSSTALLIERERKPPTFFLLSLITCLCFSPLFGIIAIIFSALSDSAWNSGDVASAKRYSQVAVSLSVVGILVSIFTLIIIFATGAIHFQN